MAMIILKCLSIFMAFFWCFVIYRGYVVPIQRLKKNSPDGNVLFLAKKKLIFSLFCVVLFAAADILVTFLDGRPMFLAASYLFLPVLFK